MSMSGEQEDSVSGLKEVDETVANVGAVVGENNENGIHSGTESVQSFGSEGDVATAVLGSKTVVAATQEEVVSSYKNSAQQELFENDPTVQNHVPSEPERQSFVEPMENRLDSEEDTSSKTSHLDNSSGGQDQDSDAAKIFHGNTSIATDSKQTVSDKEVRESAEVPQLENPAVTNSGSNDNIYSPEEQASTQDTDSFPKLVKETNVVINSDDKIDNSSTNSPDEEMTVQQTIIENSHDTETLSLKVDGTENFKLTAVDSNQPIIDELKQQDNAVSQNEFTELTHKTHKFAFLEDDGDLLDDEIDSQDDGSKPNKELKDFTDQHGATENSKLLFDSDSDSLLDSDEDFPLELITSLKSKEKKETDRTGSVSSNVSGKKYEPQLPKQSKPSVSNTFVPTTKVAGIVKPPLPFHNEGIKSNSINQEKMIVVKKLNKEKQKSDAYDFPLELVAKSTKQVPAKPVAVPIPVLQPKFEVPTNHVNKYPLSPFTNQPNNTYAHPQMNVALNIAPNLTSNSNMKMSSYAPITCSPKPPALDKPSKHHNFVPHPAPVINPVLNNGIGSSNYLATGNNAQLNYMNLPVNSNNLNLQQTTVQTIQNDILPVSSVTQPQAISPTSTTFSANNGSKSVKQTRTKSNAYNPHQSERASRYAPGSHQTTLSADLRQQQSQQSQQQYQEQIYQPCQQNAQQQLPMLMNNNSQLQGYVGKIPVDKNNNNMPNLTNTLSTLNSSAVNDQDLMNRQFPIFHWNSSNKIAYALSPNQNQTNYMVTAEPGIQEIHVVDYEKISTPNENIGNFPGPLIKGKVKNKELLKWLDDLIEEMSPSASLDLVIYKLIKMKLTDNSTFKDFAKILYENQKYSNALTQVSSNTQQEFNSCKLDANSQIKVMTYLQVGDMNAALQLALEKKDYTLALLVSSMSGKEKIASIIQAYVTDNFAETSEKNSNLLCLIFQVFGGNGKKAVNEFYTNSGKGNWAISNWNVIVASILNNIPDTGPNAVSDPLSSKQTPATETALPPDVKEFLLEYGIFLNKKQLLLSSSIVFLIANVPICSKDVIPETDVKFQSIGHPSTDHSMIWSELYEYYFAKDPKFKFFIDLLPQKLYHAHCLYEKGFNAKAIKYTDSVTATLKLIPKGSGLYITLTEHTTDLTTRMMNVNASWLGKPKLSSVWDQLDKSFNKFIGGDDDILINNTAQKKVFDGFTPVASRDSSVLDLTQHQRSAIKPVQSFTRLSANSFTPNQVPNQYTHSNPSALSSPGDTSAYQTSNTQTIQPPLLNNAQRPLIKSNVSTGAVATQQISALRKVRTDQYIPTQKIQHHGANATLGKNKAVFQGTFNDGENSMFEKPVVLDNGSALPTNVGGDIEPTSNNISQNVPNDNFVNEGDQVNLIASKTSTASSNGQEPNTEHSNPIQEPLTIGASNRFNESNYSEETITSKYQQVNLTQVTESSYNSNSKMNLMAHTSNMVDVSVDLDEQKMALIAPHPPATSNIAAYSQSDQKLGYGNDNSVVKEENIKYSPKISSSQIQQTKDIVRAEQIQVQQSGKLSTVAPRHNYNPPNLSFGNSNPMASLASRSVTAPHIETPIHIGLPRSMEENFAPIQQSEPFTKALFEPKIKVSSSANFRSMSAMPAEASTYDYNDEIEDESEDEEDLIEKKRELEKQKKMKELEEKKRLELQKKSEGNSSQQKSEMRAGSGWLSWLKKDPNEKKAIKAKLGHKTEFYYDENLKRWVNKNASEQDLQKMSSPPPPPPIVKRKNTEPQTKPRSGSGFSFKSDQVNTTPATGTNNDTQSSVDASSVGQVLDSPFNNASSPQTKIAVSAKNVSNLNDLLSLSEIPTTASTTRRKKKAGRGYVNVLDAKT